MKQIILFVFCLFSTSLYTRSYADPNDPAYVSTQNTPSQTAIDFLKWYKNFREKTTTRLVKRDGPDTTSIYRIDFNGVDLYLNDLKKSGYLSSSFLAELRAYFDRCDTNFIKYPQNDFIAQGFEVDLITKMMDDLDIMEDPGSLKTTHSKRTGNKASITLKATSPTTFHFTMTRSSNGKWKIDSVNGEFRREIEHY